MAETDRNPRAAVGSLPPLLRKRSYLEQAVAAAQLARGSWNELKVWLVGSAMERERSFLRRKGVRDENIRVCSPAELKGKPGEEGPDVILLRLGEVGYDEHLELLRALRNLVGKRPLIALVETPSLGVAGAEAGQILPEKLGSAYLGVLKALEENLGKEAYGKLYSRLMAEVPEEDFEQRLVWLLEQESVDAKSLGEALAVAVRRILAAKHVSRSFECGIISGDEAELKKLHEILDSRNPWDKFRSSCPKKTKEDKLLSSDKVDFLLDEHAKLPLALSQVWSELEKRAGKFFDFHCGRSFNKLKANEKFSLTGESRFEEKKTPALPEKEVDSSASFRRFQVQNSPLSGLMGSASGGMPGLPPTLSSLSPTPVSAVIGGVDAADKLDSYGDIFLAMLASWVRGHVMTGGMLFEYEFVEDGRESILGSIFVLAKDEILARHVDKLEKDLDLPSCKKT
ncbi:MAG: hypothetical protein HQL31_09045, partial [Planctomycetes bacterium]|nr:hypothetical protein [Planctomycetota bacterium]